MAVARFVSLCLLAGALEACMQPHVDIDKAPPNVPKIQAQLDDLQCSNQAQYTGIYLFQPLFYFYGKNLYKTCLENKGYTVKP
jgi:hypothetical protein